MTLWQYHSEICQFLGKGIKSDRWAIFEEKISIENREKLISKNLTHILQNRKKKSKVFQSNQESKFFNRT